MFHLRFFRALLFLFPIFGWGQDLRLFSVASPADGCTLSNNENVSIIIINVGPQLLGASFDVTYTLNGGAPITENIVLPPVFNNGALLSYTFSVPANLSVPGTYTIDSYINLSSDVNRSNDTIANFQVINYPLTVGGSTGSTATVCSGSNSGSITLTGHTGSILGWESSPNGSTWSAVTNTTATNSYLNITATTHYRAIIKSGTCPQEYSSSTIITVDPVTSGGTVSGSNAVCPGTSGTLNLSGYAGSILNWESSTDNGATWTTISNTTTTHTYSAISVPKLFRAHIKSGVCPDAYSSQASITILPASDGGTTAGSATVCSGTNSGNITLSGETGNVVRWEKSTNGGSTWQNVTNTTNTLSYVNLTTTTQFRAVVLSCTPSATSSVSTITVNPSPVAGSLSGAATVCATSNTGTITLTGSVGTVTWESSPDGINWSTTPGSTSTYTYNNLSATTHYRAKLSSSPCTAVYSNTVTISVDPASDGGSITGSTTVCITGNSGSLQLTQYTGNVQKWESSTNNGATWTNITNTSDFQNFTNLVTTTIYRAQVKSGVCPSQKSDTAEVTVISATVAGYISGTDSVCYGEQSTLTLNGYAGNITAWQVSAGDSLNWQNTSDLTSTISSAPLNGLTYYRAIVGTGTCAPDTSAAFGIQVVVMNGSAGNDTTVNEGTQISLHGSGGLSYEWQPASNLSSYSIASPAVTLSETTTFTLYTTGLLGCTDTSLVTVTVIDNSVLFIPNLISPNADGINDTWNVEGIEKMQSEVTIFNSNGQILFTASPYVNNWDGTVNGSTAPDGVYYYKLVLTDKDNNQSIHKGHINLKSR